MAIPTAVVVGVGASAGIGGALCRRFAQAGCHVIVAGRSGDKVGRIEREIRAAGGHAQALCADATREEDVVGLFDVAMRAEGGRAPADLVVFNPGHNQRLRFTQTSAAQFEEFWRVGCFAGFLVGRETARRLPPAGGGSLIFTGASASLRGRPGFAHFSAAKAGLRMIAQSMAREYGPQGLHVAHVIVDGGVDGERLHRLAPDMAAKKGADGLLEPDAIAEVYWMLHRQPASAWTHEIDLRPFKEPF